MLKTIEKVCIALEKGNYKPLPHFLKQLHRCKDNVWSEDELVQLQALLRLLFRLELTEQALQLLQALGAALLLPITGDRDLPLTAVKLYDDAFLSRLFTTLPLEAMIYGSDTPDDAYFLKTAALAAQLGKVSTEEALYEAFFQCSGIQRFYEQHPLVLAARDHNHRLAEVYQSFKATETVKFLKFNLLEQLIPLDDCFCVQLALDEENANILAPTDTGESLLTLARTEEMKTLLLRAGAEPTDPRLPLLRQAVTALENGCWESALLEKILSFDTPLLRFACSYSGSVPREDICWDLPAAAAKHKNIPVLERVIPLIKADCTDWYLLDLLENTLDRLPGTAGEDSVLAALELMDRNELRLQSCFLKGPEATGDYMELLYASHAARLLDMYCDRHQPEELSDPVLLQTAQLLWRIGSISGTRPANQDLLLLGLRHHRLEFLKDCLSRLQLDFSLLDTDSTTAVWNTIYSFSDETEDRIALFLRLVTENGGNINHQTASGNTALHAAVRYDYQVPPQAKRLLIEAGADPNITNNQGQRPDQVKAHTPSLPFLYRSLYKQFL